MPDDLILLLDEEDDIILEDDLNADIVLIDDIPYTSDHYPIYDGEYVVTPILDDAQTLSTKNTVLVDDVTVEAIPVTRTTNIYGGYTIVIG